MPAPGGPRHPPQPPRHPAGHAGDPPFDELRAKRMQDLDTLCQIITQWNANRLDLFALSLPNEELEFHGVMRFYYQSHDQDGIGQKVATKCIRVSSTATTKLIIETLIEKFRPDMKMLEVPEYALYEIHESGERRLNPEEKPLLVQLNWHKDDREGRFLLRRIDEASRIPEATHEDSSFKRKLSKREKKQLKKQEKINKMKEKENRQDEGVAEKLYTEVPDTSFTRSISNPEAVMRRRRQQKLEKKLQQFRSKDGGPDTGGTLKIYGETLCKDVPYKTLLLSISDSAAVVVEEMLEKYGKDRREAHNFCLVQCMVDENGTNREYYLEDDECPLAILMHFPPAKGGATFHVRVKPADFFPRKRKKRPDHGMVNDDGNLPFLMEVNPDGSEIRGTMMQRFLIPPNVTEVGTDPAIQGGGNCLLLTPGPFLFPRHCVLAHTEGIVTITPSHREAETFVNQQRIFETTILQHGCLLQIGRGGVHGRCFRFYDPLYMERERMRPFTSSVNLHDKYEMTSNANYVHFAPPIASTQPQRGNDNILPAVLEFREETEEPFFDSITISLDPNKVQFKLAPTYTIYMATRFRASTHYRPELVPEERAIRLTEMLNNVSERIFVTVGASQHDASRLAFWMANASELLHFLKSDRHITSFSLQAQDVLADSVHLAFKQLVLCLQGDLKNAMPQMMSNADEEDGGQTIKGIMLVLSAAMNLLRKCRVNAALTIQLFSQCFHFINMWTFNQIILSGKHGGPNFCTHRWGLRLKKRLSCIETWAEKQGLELAADCHLARVVQAAHLLLARKNTAEDIASVSSICFKLNSLQLKTLLHKYEPGPNETPISGDMIDTIVRVAENTVDEMTNSEGREVRLEEDFVLQLPFLLPEDGYSCDIVRGVPGGLVEFVAPMQQVGLCIMTPQPTSSGYWTIYMDRLDLTPAMSSPVPRSPSEMSQITMTGEMPFPIASQQYRKQPIVNEPEIQILQLAKSTSGMGLSIVAAKGVGKDKLGIYIKAVVEGGAAFYDGRLQAGDQLLKVDGHSLVGITQERAAEIMMQTGTVVELEVAKQGAIYHGLATLLSQPSPLMARSGNAQMKPRLQEQQHIMPQSKSVSSLYHGQGPQVHPNQNSTLPGGSMNHQLGPVYSRSSSVQNLAPSQRQMPHVTNGRPQLAPEEHNFYQNVGPSHAFPNQQHHGPLRHSSQSSLQHHPASPAFYPSMNESELFHASPRVVGTPQAISKHENQAGPEKPQRHYAYGGEQDQTHRDAQFKEPQMMRKDGGGMQSTSLNRVRFQEPTDIRGHESHDIRENNIHYTTDQTANQLEQLRVTSIEREFRRRVAEYKKDNDSASDSELPSKEMHSKLHSKQLELEAHHRAEQRLLHEAEKRRLEKVTTANDEVSSNGISGPPPPPQPNYPPPESTPPPPPASAVTPPGTQRLDMLVGGVTKSPTKRVSFMTVEDQQGNDDSFDDNANFQNEKLSRLERTEQDPNAFINEAESLLNASSLSLERFNFNNSTGNTPSVIGAQEVYRDPRMKRLQKAQEEKATSKQPDGAKLSFKEKMRLFAVEAGENTIRDKAKISKAQRDIEEDKKTNNGLFS